MRMLFTFAGGFGHFAPLVPLARAAVARGAEVVVACQPAMLRAVGSAGFTAVESGGSSLPDPQERGPLLPVDRRRELEAIQEFFAGSCARERATRLLAVATNWAPDVIVHDEVDFGAAVSAEKLGVPHVAVIVLAAGGLVRPELLSRPLNTLRVDFGLPVDPELSMLHRHLTLVPVPPSFRDPDDPLPVTAQHIRPAVLSGASEPAVTDAATARTLEWIAACTGRPTVYFTLGTVFHQESGDLFPRVMTALARLDANVVITVGNEIDPDELGTPGSNMRIERFIPQHVLLPHCQVAITHAGSGSVIGALAFGVPLVLLPMGADQPWNADRCRQLGVAEVLDAVLAGGPQISQAVNTVLSNDRYRRAAGSLRDEVLALPGVDHAVNLIDSIARPTNPGGS